MERTVDVQHLAESRGATPPADAGRFSSLVSARVPDGAKVLVVTQGDGGLLQLGSRQAFPFPQSESGTDTGQRPAGSADAIAHLESLRRQGAEFFALPPAALGWLDRYDGFRQHLEQHYRVVAREKDAGLIFGVRRELDRRTFSVVVCTYRRAAFVGKALESLFEQDYPKDKYEIIVVDNDSPDDTADVVRRLMPRSPVPISYFVEKRNGLSYARNLGIEKSGNEYVAYLDDDATARTNWLSAFNAVIDGHHALVVGGRVEKVFEQGFAPPDWFDIPYLQGFFGINYRDRKKNQKVFRIRHPLYIGGGNSAYARRLLAYFGGYDPRLGRDGRTLLAGEETYLNLTIDRNDVPIFYTDDAVIDHFIESYRVTKAHLRTKAWWAGISDGIIAHMFFDREERREQARAMRQEMKRLLKTVRQSPGDPENFSRRCRATHCAAFLHKYNAVRLRRLLGRKLYRPKPVRWDPKAWVEELTAVPDGPEKFRQLRDFHLAMGDEPAARAAHAELLSIDAAAAESFPAVGDGGAAGGSLKHGEYTRLAGRIRQLVRAELPPGATVIVVSKGDRRLVELSPCDGWHFPQDESGAYAGFHPADSGDAVRRLEALRARGGRYLLFPVTSLWWLDHYPGLREYLDRRASVVLREEGTCLVYDLASAPAVAAAVNAADENDPGVTAIAGADRVSP